MQERIKGIATICGKDYSFGAEGGYGLILLDGHWTVVEFSCPFETLPPRGAGHVITQTFQLRVTAGQMFYEGQPVHVAI